MKKYGCIISSAVVGVYKIVQIAFNAIAKGLSSLLVTTGLIVPCAYFLFGVVLTAVFGFSASDGSVNATIYKTGMGVSFVVAILLFVYNVFIRPVKRASRARIAKHKLEPEDKKDENSLPPAVIGPARPPASAPEIRYPYDNAGYAGTRLPAQRLGGREVPLIYRSKVHAGVIVYEYSDCFRLYREEGGKLILIKVQPKD